MNLVNEKLICHAEFVNMETNVHHPELFNERKSIHIPSNSKFKSFLARSSNPQRCMKQVIESCTLKYPEF